jgi:hypothetical protein
MLLLAWFYYRGFQSSEQSFEVLVMWPFSKKKPPSNTPDRGGSVRAAFVMSMCEDLIFLVPIKIDGKENVEFISELTDDTGVAFRESLVEDLKSTAENILAVKGYHSAVYYLSIFNMICYGRASLTFACNMSDCGELVRTQVKLGCKYNGLTAECLSMLLGLSEDESCELIKIAEHSYERYDVLVAKFIESLGRS